MRCRSAFVALALAGWLPLGAVAQGRPDFSGKWVADQPPAPAAKPGAPAPRGDMGSGWGSPITITQDARQLVVEYTPYTSYDLQPPLRLAYALHGSESRNTLMRGRGQEVLKSRASWEGSRLVITTMFTHADPSSTTPLETELRQALSMESGSALVVEATRSGFMGGPSSTTQTVYRRN
jgi:hypothetical protein